MGIKCEHSGGHENQFRWGIGIHNIWKKLNPGSHFGATSWTAMPSQPICLIFAVDWLVWLGYLAGSSKTAPRILIFSILMGADYSSKLKSMPIWVLAFCAHNNLCLGKVCIKLRILEHHVHLSAYPPISNLNGLGWLIKGVSQVDSIHSNCRSRGWQFSKVWPKIHYVLPLY